MKKITTLCLVLILVLACSVALAACGGHEHNFATEWSKDATHHWYACTDSECTEVKDKAEHTWNDGVVDPAATYEAAGTKTFTCTVSGCGQKKTETVAKLEYSVPGQLVILNAVATGNDGIVEITWSWQTGVAIPNGGKEITEYEYTYDNWTTVLSEPSTGAHAQMVSISGLTNGTAYTFKVRAVNELGAGPEITKSATPFKTQQLNKPVIEAIEVGGVKMLVWVASGYESSYTLAVTLDDGPWTDVGSFNIPADSKVAGQIDALARGILIADIVSELDLSAGNYRFFLRANGDDTLYAGIRYTNSQFSTSLQYTIG